MVNSKRISWVDYRDRFGGSPPSFVPNRAWTARSWRGRKQRRLPWGVRTSNTVASLLPDLLYPVVFFLAWVKIAP